MLRAPQGSSPGVPKPRRSDMSLLQDLLTLLLTIQLNLYDCSSLVPQVGLRKICPTCRGSSGSLGVLKGHVAVPQSREDYTSTLTLGEPCGVYTLACGRGLRCLPPEGDHGPLQALLHGRGICRTIKASIETPHPSGNSSNCHKHHLEQLTSSCSPKTC